jgi:hypothetical protein
VEGYQERRESLERVWKYFQRQGKESVMQKAENVTLQRVYDIGVGFPLVGLMKFPPVLLLAVPSAYASAQFAMHHGVMPFWLAWAMAVGFEWIYVGSLALSSRIRNARLLFWLVNLIAVLVAVTFGTLHAATVYGVVDLLINGEHRVMWRWIFALLHISPLAGLGLLYNLLIHSYDQQQLQQQAFEQEKTILKPFVCPGCGAEFEKAPQLYGHVSRCKPYQALGDQAKGELVRAIEEANETLRRTSPGSR